MAPNSVYDSLEPIPALLDALDEPLPLGPEGLLHGKLDNGLTYYVRKVAKPKERAAIAIAVKVGSVVEDENEQGVAHILEHLAFNATENYSNHAIVKFLERIGAEFGACQNAYTSSDETVYQLTVPSDNPQLLDEAIGVLAEFAFKIRCHASDLQKERGPVMEEWRMSRDTNGRASEAHWKLIMQGSKYAERLPIGLESTIKGVKAETVKGFFDKWYRPEHMAVAVVGDIDPEVVRDSIAKHLSQGRGASLPPGLPLPTYSFAPHTEPRCKVMVDKEAQQSSVYVSFNIDRKDCMTPRQYLDSLQEMVFEYALSNRLFKLSRLTDPPFSSASVTQEPLTATVQSNVLSAVAMEGASLRAVESLLTEVARARLHGFYPKEVDRALRHFRSEVENTYLERDQGYCWDVRDEYLRHFLNKEFVTGQELEARMSKTLLPLVTHEGVEGCAKAFSPSASCVVKVVEHRRHCTDKDLHAVISKVQQMEKDGLITPWDDGVDTPDELMPPETIPAPGTVVSERHFGGPLDATELTLSNGMRVCFKCTDYFDDEVLLTGFAFGGLSEVPQELLFTASMAGTIAGQLGVCGFKPSVMSDILAGKRVQADISESAYLRNIRGSNSPSHLEEAFQMVHLLFKTNVEVDADELAVVMRLVREAIEAQLRNPTFHYSTRVKEVLYGDHYYFKPMTLEDLDKVDAAMSCAMHNMSFRNPAEFTLVLTGKLDRESLLPLICTYLASIPATTVPPPKPPTEITPLAVTYPDTPVVEDVQVDMISPITQTQIAFPIILERVDARERLVWLSLACRLLETRLLQRLRFKFGEIYTVTVNSYFGCEAPSNTGDLRGDVSISFTCDPANRAKLAEMALEEVEALQETGPTAEEVETLKTLERLSFENSQQENSYWHGVMVSGYQSKSYQTMKDLRKVYEVNLEAREKVLAAVGPETARDALRQLFPYPCRSKYVAVSMVPRPQPLLSRLLSGLKSTLGSVGAALGLPLAPRPIPTLPLSVEGVEEAGATALLGAASLDGTLEGSFRADPTSPGAAGSASWRGAGARSAGVGSVGGVGALQRSCSGCSDPSHGHQHGRVQGPLGAMLDLVPGGGTGLLVVGAAAAVALAGLRVWYGRSSRA